MQKDSRARNVHASTAIEGNPLTLHQVRALAVGLELDGANERSEREALNCYAGLRHIETHTTIEKIGHEDVLKLHRLLASNVMDQGSAGRYRTVFVSVGSYRPPPPEDVSGLMFELLEWWSQQPEASATHEKALQSLIIIHDDLNASDALQYYLELTGNLRFREWDFPSGKTRRAFAKLVQLKKLAIRKVAEKTTGFPADFYLPS